MAARVRPDRALSVLAVEVLLKRLLHADLADDGVHRIAEILVFSPVLLINRTGVADNIAGGGGVDLTFGLGLDLDAGQLVMLLHDLGDKVDARVGRHRVVVVNRKLLARHLVAHAHNADLLEVGIRVGHAVILAQTRHDLRGIHACRPVLLLAEALQFLVVVVFRAGKHELLVAQVDRQGVRHLRRRVVVDQV